MTPLANAMDEVRSFLTTYIHFPRPEQPDALALWITYTHWFGKGQNFGFVPYMLVTSAERQSAKSTVLELAAMLVHEPLSGQDMSAATVARLCGARTLLLDEIDGVYSARESGDDPAATDLRTILNAGFKHDGKYHRLDRATLKPQEFSVYGPKMLVGIGRNVPDTVQDRSIAIRMERKPHSMRLPKVRDRLLQDEAAKLHQRLADLSTANELGFLDQDVFPEILDGRRQDIWEPLYALANAAGDDWFQRTIQASIELTKAEPIVSMGVQLLGDIRDVFDDKGNPDMIPTNELIGRPEDRRDGAIATGLCAIEESPWATWARGGPISPRKLALMLKEYDVFPEREPGADHSYGPKGYWLAHFKRPWERYLPDPDDKDDTVTDPKTGTVPGLAFQTSSTTRVVVGEESSEPAQLSLSQTMSSVSSMAPTRMTVPCTTYSGHRTRHRWTGEGWVCDACAQDGGEL
jgi:uncharacterized protein DUF3631